MIVSEVVSGMAGPLFKLVDDLFTSDDERAKAKLALVKMQQDGRLAERAQEMSVVLSDSQSKDPWTSRARPSFLYVFYILLLWAIPTGVLAIFNPEAADAMGLGFKAWLDGIPEEAWTAFWICFTGYTGARTYEKHKGVAK